MTSSLDSEDYQLLAILGQAAYPLAYPLASYMNPTVCTYTWESCAPRSVRGNYSYLLYRCVPCSTIPPTSSPVWGACLYMQPLPNVTVDDSSRAPWPATATGVTEPEGFNMVATASAMPLTTIDLSLTSLHEHRQ